MPDGSVATVGWWTFCWDMEGKKEAESRWTRDRGMLLAIAPEMKVRITVIPPSGK